MATQEHILLVESRQELSSSEDIRPAAPAEIIYSEPVVVPPEAPPQLDRISSGSIIQDGVQAIEGIARSWDGRLLTVSYLRHVALYNTHFPIADFLFAASY